RSEDQAACKRIGTQFSNEGEIQVRCRHSKYSHPRCHPHMATISKQQMAEVTQMIPPICIQFPNCNTRCCVLGREEALSKIGNRPRRVRLRSRPWGSTAQRWRTCQAGILPGHGGKLAICEEGRLGKTVPSCSQSDRRNHSDAWRRPTERFCRGGRLLPANGPAMAGRFPRLRCGLCRRSVGRGGAAARRVGGHCPPPRRGSPFLPGKKGALGQRARSTNTARVSGKDISGCKAR